MAETEGWTYLPKGTYTAVPYFRIGDEIFDLSEVPVTRDEPIFIVTAYAETSYSRYQNYKKGVSGYTLDLANKDGTAEKVMDIKGTVSISDAILSDSKYSSLISATLTYDNLSMLTNPVVNSSTFYANTLENNINLFEDGAVINQAWGTHYVKAAFTFDGVAALSSSDSSKVVSELVCHLTGLPYTMTFKKDTTISGWIFDNYEDPKGLTPSTSYIAFKPTAAYAKSPKFMLPENVNVSIMLPYAIYSSVVLWSGYNNYSPTVYVDTISNSSSPTKSGASFSCGETSNDPDTDNRFNAKEIDRTLSETKNCVSIYIYGEKHRSTSIDRTIIQSCTIKYR